MPGDANGDGLVNVNDLNTVLTNYNKTLPAMPGPTATLTATTSVDGVDLNPGAFANITTVRARAPPFPSLRLLALLAIGAFS